MERRQVQAQSTPSCFQRLCPCLPAKPTARQGKPLLSNCDGHNKQSESAASIAVPPTEVASKLEPQSIAVAFDGLAPQSPPPPPPVDTYTETDRLVPPPSCSTTSISPEAQLTTIEALPEDKVVGNDAFLGPVAQHQQDGSVLPSGHHAKGAPLGGEHSSIALALAEGTPHVSPPTAGDASVPAAVNAVVDSAWHGPVIDASASSFSAVVATVTNPEAQGSVSGLVSTNVTGTVSRPACSKCKMCGNTGMDFLGKPCTCQIGQKTVLAPSAAIPTDKAQVGKSQKTSINAPPIVSLKEPDAAVPCAGAFKPWQIPSSDLQPAIDAKVSSMLDRHFEDEAFWQQVAAEIATVKQRQIVDALGGALTKGRGRFRVTVPKPYPGVQFRKSKQLNDRHSRFAKQGFIVEGYIEDGGEWLRVNEKDYLPMRMGPIRILEPLPLGSAAHAEGNAQWNALDLDSNDGLPKGGLELPKKGALPPPSAAGPSTQSAAAAAGKSFSGASKKNPSLVLNERLYSDTIQKEINPFSDSPR